MSSRTKVLFLCIGNACRSQMAEAIARDRASDVIEASSAGLVPFGEIPRTTLAVLGELGISGDGLRSKPLGAEEVSSADLVINLTGHSGPEIFTGRAPRMEDWQVGDPFGFNLSMFRSIRDQISTRVDDLAERLRRKAVSAETN
jgi:arsenate reductase (thioredoxin)